MKAEDFDRYHFNDGTLYEGESNREAEAIRDFLWGLARDARRSPNKLYDLSRIPIPQPSGPRFYGFRPSLFRVPTAKEAGRARHHKKRYNRWIAELELFYGPEGAKRIAHWLR